MGFVVDWWGRWWCMAHLAGREVPYRALVVAARDGALDVEVGEGLLVRGRATRRPVGRQPMVKPRVVRRVRGASKVPRRALDRDDLVRAVPRVLLGRVGVRSWESYSCADRPWCSVDDMEGEEGVGRWRAI